MLTPEIYYQDKLQQLNDEYKKNKKSLKDLLEVAKLVPSMASYIFDINGIKGWYIFHDYMDINFQEIKDVADRCMQHLENYQKKQSRVYIPYQIKCYFGDLYDYSSYSGLIDKKSFCKFFETVIEPVRQLEISLQQKAADVLKVISETEEDDIIKSMYRSLLSEYNFTLIGKYTYHKWKERCNQCKKPTLFQRIKKILINQ
jgi:hypothetical protein